MADAASPSQSAPQAGPSDKVLVERAAAGDRHAFSMLVERHYERALRVAYGLVKSRPDAEDVIQDAFVKVHRRLGDFRAASGFYTWLYRIVVNLSIDRLRKQRRDRQVHVEDDDCRDAMCRDNELWPNFPNTDPHMRLHRRELREDIRRAFSRLPEIHQAVIALREIEGLSYEEIAETLDIKVGTVMSRLFHARRAMQRELRLIEERESSRTSSWLSVDPTLQPALALN